MNTRPSVNRATIYRSLGLGAYAKTPPEA